MVIEISLEKATQVEKNRVGKRMLKLMGSYFKASNILGRDRVMVRVDGDA